MRQTGQRPSSPTLENDNRHFTASEFTSGTRLRSADDEELTKPLPTSHAKLRLVSLQGSDKLPEVLDKAGPYRLAFEFASGGMANVYLGVNVGLSGFERVAAVKRVHSELGGDSAFSAMFAHEARIIGGINHPFVCQVFDFGRSERGYYLAMEFLQGEPLSKVLNAALARREIFDSERFPRMIARAIANVAEGLHAAHSLVDPHGQSLEVVHRDVTPQNLFVLFDGTVRVTDFGIARTRQRVCLTQPNMLRGKLSYMAPEQLNRGSTDRRVDIWALGVVFWECLTGERLFCGESEGETIAALLASPVDPPSKFNARVSPELDRIVLRALERDVAKRYPTAREFSRDIERHLSGLGDAVPAMDLAEWMQQLFPEGLQLARRMIEQAREIVLASPSLQPTSGDDTRPTVRPAPPTPGYVTIHSLAEEPITTVLPRRRVEHTALQAALLSISTPASPPRPNVPLPKSRRIALLLTCASCLLLGAAAVIAAVTSQPPAPPISNTSVAVTDMKSSVVAEATAEAATTNASPTRAAEPGVRAPAELAASPASQLAPPLAAQPSQVAPSSQAPPARTLPKASRRSDEAPAPAAARSAAPEPSTTGAAVGSVFVSTPGAQAQVFEGGRSLGQSPGRFALSVGAHTLTLKSGNETRSVVIEIRPGALSLVTVPLTPRPEAPKPEQ